LSKFQLPVQKNQKIRLVIDNLDNRAFGVGRYEGAAIFVEGALPGETVEALIIKCAKNYAVGKLLSIIEPCAERVEASCEVYAKCGGCSLQHMAYDAQLVRKQIQVRDAMQRLGGFADVEIRTIIGADETTRYRNKAQFPVGQGPVTGFYRRRSHDVIDVADCPIQSKNAMQACAALKFYMRDYEVSAYDEKTGKGLVRHIMTRTNRKGEILVTIVVNGKSLPEETALCAVMRRKVDGLVGVVLNTNTRRDNVIMGNACRTLWGSSTIEETLCDKVFSISPLSFFQVNTAQTEKLYREARKAAAMDGKGTLLDLYCGIGTIGITMADDCEKLIGIESVEQAVEDAKKNALRNDILNAEFYTARAEDLLPKMAAKGQKADVAVLDPPRAGCEEELLRAVCTIAPERIVYVSCNPATLARDAKFLCENGYTLHYVQPVDLFPMTEHVESIASFTHN